MEHSRKISYPEMILFGLAGLVSFMLFLGAAPLFDWDEINFAESAREMIVSGNYFQVQIDYQPFWEKPPLFIWLQVLSMKAFGVNEFAARFPNVLCGMFTLMALYGHGVRLRGTQFGRMLPLLYLATLLPHLYFKSGIIDPLFNLFIFLAVIQLVHFEMRPSGAPAGAAPWVAGYWIGMAVLTKGPVALLVFGIVALLYYSIYRRFRFPWLALLAFLLVCILVVLSWFGSILLFTPDGKELILKFIRYQLELASQNVAGHEQPVYYHILIFTFACLPMSAFAYRGMGLRREGQPDAPLKRLMLIWFWVILVIFSLVRTKIVHYSSMLYFPGAFLAAYWLEHMLQERKRLTWDSWTLLLLPILIIGTGFTAINFVVSQLPQMAANAGSVFVRGMLSVQVEWTGLEFLLGLLFLAGGLVNVIWLLRRQRVMQFLLAQAILTAVFLNGINAVVLPRVARYTQGAALDFFRAHAAENPFFIIVNYKSYAQYFYGRVQPFPYPEIPQEDRERWILYGEVDRPVYLVTKVDRIDDNFRDWYKHFTPLYQEGGFAFFVRTPDPLRSPVRIVAQLQE